MSVTINSITFDGDGHVVFKFSNGLKQRILIPAPETKLTVGWFLDNILAVTLEGSNLIVEYLSGQSVTYTLSDEGVHKLCEFSYRRSVSDKMWDHRMCNRSWTPCKNP